MNDVLYMQSLQKAPLYEQIANLMEQQILKNYEDGYRLPSEQQLADQFQVSRTIVREALKLLKERGLIDSKTGSGAYVTKPDSHNISNVMSRIICMDQINYNDVFDVRIILETEAAVRAARYADELQLSEMEACLEKLKNQELSPEERSSYDFNFHYLIAKASRNPLLAVLTEAVGAVCREIISKAVLVPGGIQDGIMRHEKIYQNLCVHDERAVRVAIVEHLEKSRRNYAEYLEGNK